MYGEVEIGVSVRRSLLTLLKKDLGEASKFFLTRGQTNVIIAFVLSRSLHSLFSPHLQQTTYSKTCVKRPLSKRPKVGFQHQLSLNVGQKYCRMLQWEYSVILSTFIKLPFVIKIFVLFTFEWPFYTGFTVFC